MPHPILIAAAMTWYFSARTLPDGKSSDHGPYPSEEDCVAQERALLQKNATAIAEGRQCYVIDSECPKVVSPGFSYMPDWLRPSEKALPADCPTPYP